MVTIARTMLADPRILILDEATSRLDAYSESLVQDAQERLFSNRTTIVIAHRLTTIAHASRVLVFDHGELVEQGTHEELLALGGVFKALYDTYYAHQGVEEISEETVEVAKTEVEKAGEQVKMAPGSKGMMFAMGMSPPEAGGMRIPPEKMKELMEHPERLPPEMREKIREMMEKRGPEES